LLSAIKNEYEMMIIHQRDKIRELEPLKVMSKCCFKSFELLVFTTCAAGTPVIITAVWSRYN
jgi:hypothetical protein